MLDAIASVEIKSVTERLVEFLEEKQVDFIELWKKQVKITADDPYISGVKDNGIQMYELIKRSLTAELSDEDILLLANKIAKERVAANINIGDFVHNMNIGRSIIVKYINHSGISIEELQPIIDNINSLFDNFCFYAVTKYTELKDKQLEEKVVYINQTHKDRLSLLGQMSSSFVHEFRNPLTSIMGFIKLLKSDYPDLQYLDTIDLELDQLNFRVTQFLHTSKMEVLIREKEEFSITILLDELLKFIYPSIVDVDVQVVTDIEDDEIILAYRDEIKQVFLNLLLNSIDAVKENDYDRVITVRCKSIQDSVIFSVSNNGPQIPNETIKTIFEPFYTTKELGTGIGLYVCKRIIEKHEGSITCDSKKESTTFSIHLPVKQE